MLSRWGHIGFQLKQAGIYNPSLLFACPSIQVLPTQHRFISFALKGFWIWGDFISQTEVASTQEIVSTKWSLELDNLSLLRIVHMSSQMRMEEILPLGCLSVFTTWQLAFSRAGDPRQKSRKKLQCCVWPSLRKRHCFCHPLFVRNKSLGQLILMGMGSKVLSLEKRISENSWTYSKTMTHLLFLLHEFFLL